MAEDYYKTLGVRRDASQDEIQKAYRNLARKYHPDVNPGPDAKKKFQDVQSAFDVLNDAKKREMYDRYGSSFETSGGRGPAGGAERQWRAGEGFSGQGFEDFDFGQFFGERFGEGGAAAGGVDLGGIFKQFRHGGERPRRGAAAGRRRGGDLQHEIRIPFTTAIAGGEVQLTVQRQDGRTETISVKIPPGIEDGKKIRLRGQGEPAIGGGAAGDILLTVRIEPHAYFQRRGQDLTVRVPVTLGEAALGAKVDVPTPKGTVTLQVPAGTSSGTKLRIKAHGVASSGGGAGDLFAEVQIVLPKQFDEESRQMIRKLEEQAPKSPRVNLRW